MSKIALSSNNSGSATFTIASLGTNTNQMLTLPDNSGTILTTADIATQAEAEAGTSSTKLMTPLGVEQAINVQAEGMVLLGTLTTTSGIIQTLSGLTLTGYKYLLLDFNGVGHSSGTNQHINFGAAQVSANVLVNTDILIGMANVSLETGVLVGSTSRQVPPNSTSIQVSQSGYSTATTSVSVSTAAGGTFDAGSVKIYGIR